jgi:dTMP kinase
LIVQGLDYDWCKSPDKGLIKPDIVFYMDLDPDNVQGRAGFGEERYERIEFQKKVGVMYNKMKADHEGSGHWFNIAAQGRDIESIHKEIVDLVKQYEAEMLVNTDIKTLEKALF